MVIFSLAIAAVAVWRWVHWKREAYATRDASLQGLRAIKQALADRGVING